VIAPGDAAIPPAVAQGNDPDAAASQPRKKGKGIVIPDGITAATRQRYETLDERVGNIEKALDDLEAGIPNCGSGSACDDAWREWAGRSMVAAQMTGWMGMYCPTPQRAETEAFLRGVEEKRARLQKRRVEIEQKAANKLGNNGLGRLERYTDDYIAAHPMPCLSMACDGW